MYYVSKYYQVSLLKSIKFVIVNFCTNGLQTRCLNLMDVYKRNTVKWLILIINYKKKS